MRRWKSSQITIAVLFLAVGASPASGACPSAPVDGCKLAGGGKLSLLNRADDSRDQVMWKWAKGDALSRSELGDPLNATRYTLCIYAGSAQALVAEAPLPAGGWKDLNAGGYGLSNSNLDGISFVSMWPGDRDHASVALKGKGVSLPDPAMPLAAPVTVQLLADPEPLCLQTRFESEDAATNAEDRYKAQAQTPLPPPPDQIPANDRCNRNGEDGSVAEQVGAQMRRSGTEWASTCLKYFGSAGSNCNVAFPGDTPFAAVPVGVPSLVCPNVAACDSALGRVEWHAENKFARKCTFDQWNLVWRWIQLRAGTAAPPDCEITDFQPRFWGVYSCYERYFVHPLMVDMLNKLRDYETPNPPMTPACEGALVTRLWFRLASDWIRFGVADPCDGVYRDREVTVACGTGTGAPKIDEATLDAWCSEFRSFLLPVYEGVRAASGKPY